MKFRTLLTVLCIMALFAASASAQAQRASLTAGKVQLKSAGALTFGPDAILFVGDSVGATIYALDTNDRTPATGTAKVEVAGLNSKIAAMLGTMPDQILINDIAVNPISRKVYASVSRGRGATATAVIMRVDGTGKIEELSMENIAHSKATIPNAATEERRRVDAITDLAYLRDVVYVAGLSNEEFSSNLRSIPFPFKAVEKGTSVEMYHGSHGRWETNSPVRTFVAYEIANKPNLIAAYTCTPIVKLPIESLKPGSKVTGTTIAELGAGNRPLDMIVYKKGGADFILMNNSSRGVMKMATSKIDTYTAITKPTDIAGLPYETIDSLRGVEQLDAAYDGTNAIILARGNGGLLDLKTIALP
jgi:hypothetical protein